MPIAVFQAYLTALIPPCAAVAVTWDTLVFLQVVLPAGVKDSVGRSPILPGEANVPQVMGMLERIHMTGRRPRVSSVLRVLFTEADVTVVKFHATSAAPASADRSHGLVKPVAVGG